MFNISEYLKKFSLLEKNTSEKIFVFKEIVAPLGLDLNKYKITYNKGAFTVDCPNAIKNIIFIKKDSILEALGKRNIRATDIL